ncbi:MAG: DUF6603 domain-containing protein [Rhodospirillaceae bacterium]
MSSTPDQASLPVLRDDDEMLSRIKAASPALAGTMEAGLARFGLAALKIAGLSASPAQDRFDAEWPVAELVGEGDVKPMAVFAAVNEGAGQTLSLSLLEFTATVATLERVLEAGSPFLSAVLATAAGKTATFLCTAELRVSSASPDADTVVLNARVQTGEVTIALFSGEHGKGIAMRMDSVGFCRFTKTGGLVNILEVVMIFGTTEYWLDLNIPTGPGDLPYHLKLNNPVSFADGLKSIGVLLSALTGEKVIEDAIEVLPGLPFLEAVSLSDIDLLIGRDGALRHLYLEVRNTKSWQPLPWLSVHSVGLGCTVIPGGRPMLRAFGDLEIDVGDDIIELAAEATVATGSLTLLASGSLASRQGLATLVKSPVVGEHGAGITAALGGEILAVTGVHIAELSLEYDGKEKKLSGFGLDLMVAGTFTLGPVRVVDPDFAIRGGGGGLSLRLEARVILGDDLVVSASAGYEDGCWTFSAMRLGEPVEIGHVWKAASGDRTTLPEIIDKTAIDRLILSYRTGKDARFDASVGTRSTAVNTSLDLVVAEGERSITGQLDFGDDGPDLSAFVKQLARDAGDDLPAFDDIRLRQIDLGWSGKKAKPTDADWETALSVYGELAVGGGARRLGVGLRASRTGTVSSSLVAIGLRPDLAIDMSHLPLVGKLAPPATVLAFDAILLALGTAGESGIAEVETLVAAGMEGWTAKGPLVAIKLAGGDPFRVPLRRGGKSEEGGKGQTGGGESKDEPRQGADAGGWHTLDKAVGPLRLRRIKGDFQDGLPWLRIDAGVALGPVTFDLLGFGVGVGLGKTTTVHFALAGISFAYETPALKMGASLELIRDPKADDPDLTWLSDGGAPQLVLKGGFLATTPRFGLAGSTVYAQLADYSVFVATVSASAMIGGPPAFFVTGLTAGFGVNAQLRSPTVETLDEFPLLAGSRDLTGWLTAGKGEAWIAVGVAFNSFLIVQGQAFLLAKFGSALEFALLGSATVEFPTKPPGATKTDETPVFARVTLKLMAAIKPVEGIISVAAVIGSDSFLLDPQCRLSGGAAYTVWMAGAHAGDFVLSVGGYHPDFRVPAHYPKVPRVALSWKMSDNLSVRGDLYFAITPAYMMFGNALDLQLDLDPLHAWLHSSIDVLLAWAPFHYTATANVRVGVTYTFRALGFSHTFQAEVGAALTLWGPPVAGKAVVDCSVVSFEIAFGDAGKAPAPAPVASWTDVTALLPAKPVTITLDGASVDRRSSGRKGEPVLVRPEGLTFIVESAIPLTELVVDGLLAGVVDSGAVKLDGKFPIRPMKRDGKAALTITLGGGPALRLGGAKWTTRPRRAKLPSSLWGNGGANDPDLVDLPVGVTVTAPLCPGSGGPNDLTTCAKTVSELPFSVSKPRETTLGAPPSGKLGAKIDDFDGLPALRRRAGPLFGRIATGPL